MPVARRTLLRAGTISVPAASIVLDQRPTAAAPRLTRFPFRLGVASGDPRPDGFVIWTRLAMDPWALDGGGGMPLRRIEVRYQVATDPGFSRIVRDGWVTTTPGWGHSARVVLRGLRPAREYWYRWRVPGHVSSAGRALTSPGSTSTTRLRLLQLCCSAFGPGYFNVYRHAAEERADLVVHLGDYIYENASDPDSFRVVLGPECRTLGDYRLRYAQYRADPDLQAAHAASPWLVTFDDHEVDNNYAGLTPTHPDPEFAARRAAAYQAWFENQPVRFFSRPSGPNLRMHRRVRWGDLVALHLLDTRQYRSDQPCNQSFGDCPDRLSPERSMLGEDQNQWLAGRLARSSSRWAVLAQQVFFGRRYVDRSTSSGYMLDGWDGYVHNRKQVLDMIDSTLGPAPRNSVVLTGDTHNAWLADVKRAYLDPDSATLGTEIGCTSVTSSGNGFDTDGTHPLMKNNPHLRFYNALRGYTRLTFKPDQLKIDYRVVDSVRRQDTEMWTRASFVVPDREAAAVALSQRAPDPTSARMQRAPADLTAATLREELGTVP